MELRQALERILARPEAELPQWALRMKRDGRTAALVEAEVRSHGIRSIECRPAVRMTPLPAPLLSVDAENRKRLAALGKTIYQDKNLQGSITDRLNRRKLASLAREIYDGE